MLLPLFIIPIITLFFLGMLWFAGQPYLLNTKDNSLNWNSYNGIMFNLFKLITLTSFFITLFYGIYLWKYFPLAASGFEIYPMAIQFGNVNLFEVTNNLNLPFIILSTFVLLTPILTAWYLGVSPIMDWKVFYHLHNLDKIINTNENNW
jgi:hypothetical protein